jgi:hypothetical protein
MRVLWTQRWDRCGESGRQSFRRRDSREQAVSTLSVTSQNPWGFVNYIS